MNLRHAAALAIALVFILAGQSRDVGAVEATVKGVVVWCSCEDMVGERLCYAVKEAIRKSAGFELVEDSDRYALGVHMVCLDVAGKNEPEGLSSAVSTIYTITNLKSEEYLTNSLFVVGAHRIDSISGSVMGDIDKQAEGLGAAISRPRPR